MAKIDLRKIIIVAAIVVIWTESYSQNYTIVGTNVTVCYDNSSVVTCPSQSSDSFYGQFPGSNTPAYVDNGNGTITDSNTGLIWQKSSDYNGNNDGVIDAADKLSYDKIVLRVAALNAATWGGYNDWRIPTIKELFSLTLWNGIDPVLPPNGTSTTGIIPFIDNSYFQFDYGQTSAGERVIDGQYASSNIYKDLYYNGDKVLFGMNFVDGRIKGYDMILADGTDKTFRFIAVRGNTSYGINNFVDNGDETITDSATGLMWSKDDSKTSMNWQNALAWAQTKNSENYLGHNDWRVPNVKELQSIVDYSRSPGQGYAAIDQKFNISTITNEAGRTDWPFFWTSTTHYSYTAATSTYSASKASYICFGRAAGWIKKTENSYYSYYDAHGAGAQRSDPKSGTNFGLLLGVDSLGNSVYGNGFQGDIERINNYVRLVRNTAISTGINNAVSTPLKLDIYPNPANENIIISIRPNTSIDIFNIEGQRIKTLTTKEDKTKVDITNFSNGVFIIKASTEEGILTKKFIKE